MALISIQKQDVVDLDIKAKQALQQGGEEALLMSLCDKMDKIKNIMDSLSEDEFNQYCAQYHGFYRYMKLLEDLASAIADGAITVPE